ncbi:MAG: phycobiliprotein lyase [Nostocaceae cyanobacterium]|nr:phycobiliprotein lyase [Nostocaceae cyanobacterium]
MNIEEFLQLCAGKWFAHRTSHDFANNKSEEGKSEIIVENLPVEHPEVVKICQHYQIQPNPISFGAKFNWNDTTKLNQKNVGSTVVVLVPDADNPHQGKLLHQFPPGGGKQIAGRYEMGSDEALTLITESDTIYSEERLWFASPNLRMRVSVTKVNGDFTTTAFTSEIRMGVPPAAKTSQAA